jgi:hypothetical protein
MLAEALDRLARALPTFGDDALCLDAACERTAFNVPFQELVTSFGRPEEPEGCVFVLILTLGTGFEETAAAVWRARGVLKYLCWRGKTESTGELLAGACSESLVARLFLSPSVLGLDHLVRVAEARSLDAGFRPRRQLSEHAG